VEKHVLNSEEHVVVSDILKNLLHEHSKDITGNRSDQRGLVVMSIQTHMVSEKSAV